jgi:murein DD-endopeptidase MepM/ murein hydrolase activator NlpD
MPQRLNTIIVVPHSQAKFFKFSFSTRALVFTASGCGLAVLLSVLAISFTGGAITRRGEVARMRSQNQELAAVNERLAETISEVQSRLDDFEEQTVKLALAAGMEALPDVLGDRVVPSSDRFGSGGQYNRLPESPEVLQIQGDWIATHLSEVEKALARRDEVWAATPSIAPAMGLMTDGFGGRPDPVTGRHALHRGLDISARRGTPVIAPADGVVVFTGLSGGLGRTIRIAHGLGYTTVYGHLDAIQVEPGEEVRRGAKIGILGNSGRSTGPHLHYEVHVDGEAVNPLYYILDAF